MREIRRREARMNGEIWEDGGEVGEANERGRAVTKRESNSMERSLKSRDRVEEERWRR